MTILDQIIHSVRMPEYVRELNDLLAAERAKREQFYDWLTEDKKAEFINGEVIVHSPVKFEHESASSLIYKLLSIHVQRHTLGYVGHEKLLVTLTRNDYEPDIAFWNAAKSDQFEDKQMKFPAPDMAVEILSPTTQQIDRAIKFEDYAAHGVKEYWIVDAERKSIEQYLLARGVYELAAKKKTGTLQCRAIKGLKFPVAAAFDPRANLHALEAILKR
jgi:Uma2 family endonuclease